MHYLIAYDIACPKRLRRVARLLQQHAQRCQKSVFLATASPRQIQQLLDRAAELIQPEEDRIQAWALAPGQPPEGTGRGLVHPLQPACVVAGTELLLFG